MPSSIKPSSKKSFSRFSKGSSATCSSKSVTRPRSWTIHAQAPATGYHPSNPGASARAVLCSTQDASLSASSGSPSHARLTSEALMKLSTSVRDAWTRRAADCPRRFSRLRSRTKSTAPVSKPPITTPIKAITASLMIQSQLSAADRTRRPATPCRCRRPPASPRSSRPRWRGRGRRR